jgi:hypothetical protein
MPLIETTVKLLKKYRENTCCCRCAPPPRPKNEAKCPASIGLKDKYLQITVRADFSISLFILEFWLV